MYYPDELQPGKITDEYISSYYIDDQQIIWVGSQNGNIFKAVINRNPFGMVNVNTKEGEAIYSNSVSQILRVEDELWLGTKFHGIIILNSDGEQIKHHPFYKSEANKWTQVYKLTLDANQTIWIGSENGLSKYNLLTSKGEVVLQKGSIPYFFRQHVHCIATDANENIWVGIYNALLQKVPGKDTFNLYDFHKQFMRKTVMDVLVDRSGDIWAATDGAGLFRFQIDLKGNAIDTLRISYFNDYKNLQMEGDHVYTLHEDFDGFLWAGTSKGLLRINRSTLEVDEFTEKNGVIDPYVYSILIDRQGNIWFSHAKGVTKIERNSLAVTNFQILGKNEQSVLEKQAGYYDESTGYMYFGTQNGYVVFQPDHIKDDENAPQILLTQLSVSGKAVLVDSLFNGEKLLQKALYLTKDIKLDYNHRSFAIDMAALHFSSPMGIKYQYQLEGYDADWVQSTNNRATYVKIPPGSYTFKARVLSSNGKSSAVSALSVRVAPPVYKRWWAILGYNIFIVSIFYFIRQEIKARRKLKEQIFLEKLQAEKQEEMNKEKLEFFTNVSHELRTPLSLIIDPLKKLQETHLSDKKRELYFTIVNKNVLLLTQLINQILDFRKSETNNLVAHYTITDGAKMVQDCVKSFEAMALDRNIQLWYNAQAFNFGGYFDEEKLKQIVLNILSNAFKYTPDGGEISISVSYDGNHQFKVVIKDDGIGINREAQKKIFEPFNNEGSTPFYGNSSGMGLALTRKLIQVLRGQISIQSEPGKGTLVTFLIPFDSEKNHELEGMIKESEPDVPFMSKEASLAALNQTTILIVEDNLDVQHYLKAELSDAYTIISENNGVDGLNTTIKNIPDLVISDVMMPQMNGVTMCKQIKTNEKTCHIPVIMLTAKGRDEDQIEGLKTGADHYFAKPFNIEVVKAQIQSILENRLALQKKLAQKKSMVELESQDNEADNRFLKKALDVIHDNLEQVGFNTESLTEAMNISQRQLYRKLKAITGSTVQEFITRVRLERATKLLKEDELNI